MGLNQRALPSRHHRLNAEHVAREQVCRGGPPRMVPILIRFVFLIPRLPRDGGSTRDHVPPTAVATSGDEVNRGLGFAVLEQRFEQTDDRYGCAGWR